MLDLVVAFSLGGLVLWRRSLNDAVEPLVHQLVNDVLLADKHALQRIEQGPYAVRWTLDNERELVLAAVYVNVSSMVYVPELLDKLKGKFVTLYQQDAPDQPVDFDDAFNRILDRFESADRQQIQQMKKEKTMSKPPKKKKEKPKQKEPVDEEGADAGEDVGSEQQDRQSVLARLKAASRGRGARRRGAGARTARAPADSSSSKSGVVSAEPVRTKKARTWGAPTTTASAALDHSSAAASASAAAGAAEELYSSDHVERVAIQQYESEYETSSEDEVDDVKQSGGVFGFFRGLVGRQLEREHLEPAIENMKMNLLTKNVASDIADNICESVLRSLVGKTLSSLQVKSTVKQTMTETLRRILTAKVDIDLMRGVAQAQAEKRPYTVVFVGVNGVGKSTSLSKICYYLMTKNLKVLLAACDTFRAGAVEQLRTHAAALGVEVFQRGYNKDPSAVAQDAVTYARKQGHDVVLVDTAGRMQDNEPLMRSLSKLIVQNQPDLVLFVGEALVGNDGVDQLVKFNSALSELHTSSSPPRLIDGIVLTKFDTIDDKVGAAISMTYSAGIPILFVGVGQDYRDLRRMNANALVTKLLK